MKPCTVLSITQKNDTLTAWAKKHSIAVSVVNDVLHKRASYGNPSYKPKKHTSAYKILQQLILEGHTAALKADGWDISIIDTSVECIIKNRTKSTEQVSLSTSFIDISFNLADLGNEFTNNIFLSPCPEAGPIAIIYMMEQLPRITKKAVGWLNTKFRNYNFAQESGDVISVWSN